ncbi:MAG: transporter substrate-binding domain-containing protein [Beijerinckiaceae bacterium]
MALGTMLLAGAALAEPPALIDEILGRGVLRVGTTGDYEPFSLADAAMHSYRGFDIEQAEGLGRALGVKVEFIATSWPTLSADLEAKKFDLAMGGVSVTLERATRGFFSVPYLRDGKTPIARCADSARFGTLAGIDQPDVRVVVNPGGTNERFAHTHLKSAQISVFPDNRTIFEEIAADRADVMLTDASETRFQAKRHPGVLCAIHPDAPFDFAEKAIWMQRDVGLKLFVDSWLHMTMENGAFAALRAKWFE